jgi:hypothetical protein
MGVAQRRYVGPVDDPEITKRVETFKDPKGRRRLVSTREAFVRHVVGAFHHVPGARAFRRHLAENGVKPGAGAEVLRNAMALVEDRAVAALAA